MCRVTVLDDSLYEEAENFYVILADAVGGRIGKISQAEIIIAVDPADGKSFHYIGILKIRRVLEKHCLMHVK